MGLLNFLLLAGISPHHEFESHVAEVLLPGTERIVLAEAIRVYRSETALLDAKTSPNDMDLNGLLRSIAVEAAAPTATHSLFEIKEMLRGQWDVGDTLIVSIEERELTYPCDLTHDYDGHLQPEFWQGSAGRAVLGHFLEPHVHTTCFELGQNYLLLDEHLYQSRAYELIQSDEDQWYRFIQSQVSSQDD
ncbi:hypothetical protein [Marinicella meishanensis]|uniref:hypothetical protein n=1 Tax=Marinicella meishanensis TaxID=2873263 RepID=UPI001CBF7DE1|nr:hypothetical protein [Marinicella sp. NBU2979]